MIILIINQIIMPHGDNESWIQTYTGRQFWPLDPRPEDIDIRDIAHALALRCRFAGHCLGFISVAQHSVFVSYHVPPPFALTALTHDGPEAYTGMDVPKPLKSAFKELAEIEHKLHCVIAYRFHTIYPFPPEIKVADNIALATEKRDNMRQSPFQWGRIHSEPDKDKLVLWSWEQAEYAFLARFEELINNQK